MSLSEEVGHLPGARHVAEVLPLEKQVDFTEQWPVRRLPFPAFSHEIVDFSGTRRRPRQVPGESIVLVQVIAIFDYLFVS